MGKPDIDDSNTLEYAVLFFLDFTLWWTNIAMENHHL